MKYKPVVLIVLDGWGLSPSWGGNALSMNNPKNMDTLWKTYPHAILQALGAIQYGNVIGESRLGHMMIGAGRPVTGYHSQINRDIAGKKFVKNKVLLSAINHAKKNNSNLHLVGMISDCGVHADLDHLLRLLDLAEKNDFDRVFVDGITDGVDSGPTESLRYVEKIKNKMQKNKMGSFSSVGGRQYAMDRDEHWDKIKTYYDCISGAKNTRIYNSVEEAVSENYRNNLDDEMILPGLIKDQSGQTHPIKDSDAVVMFNFREDRAAQLARVFGENKFKVFLWNPKKIKNLSFTTFTKYDSRVNSSVAFSKVKYPNNLSEYLSRTGLNQLKLAESEKRAHVTLFFNGGTEGALPGEDIKIISSPNVSSYEKIPEMSARNVANEAIGAIKTNRYDFILINFANVDMLAHTGDILAVGKAVAVLDELVQKIVDANLNGGVTIITADHGNAEQMINVAQANVKEPEMLHTLNPVPFILVAKEYKKNLMQTSLVYESNALSKIISAKDSLADVAPTILELMNLPKPVEMSGHSLMNKLE